MPFLVDAFVAMGGNKDKSGHVDAMKLIDVVKNEFQMSIDIEVPSSLCLPTFYRS